ncbi:MAG: hypothetical protein M1828_004599 [Chrysothrix sp. TS-e1954]|nr:MAG: hypothetical protein M1828_004599 [Chrysothrix sp. TS-e1954]
MCWQIKTLCPNPECHMLLDTAIRTCVYAANVNCMCSGNAYPEIFEYAVVPKPEAQKQPEEPIKGRHNRAGKFNKKSEPAADKSPENKPRNRNEPVRTVEFHKEGPPNTKTKPRTRFCNLCGYELYPTLVHPKTRSPPPPPPPPPPPVAFFRRSHASSPPSPPEQNFTPRSGEQRQAAAQDLLLQQPWPRQLGQLERAAPPQQQYQQRTDATPKVQRQAHRNHPKPLLPNLDANPRPHAGEAPRPPPPPKPAHQQLPARPPPRSAMAHHQHQHPRAPPSPLYQPHPHGQPREEDRRVRFEGHENSTNAPQQDMMARQQQQHARRRRRTSELPSPPVNKVPMRDAFVRKRR